MKKLTNEELALIETAVATRIAEHEAKHEGLYEAIDLDVLRPIWRRNIISDVCECLDIMEIEL